MAHRGFTSPAAAQRERRDVGRPSPTGRACGGKNEHVVSRAEVVTPVREVEDREQLVGLAHRALVLAPLELREEPEVLVRREPLEARARSFASRRVVRGDR